MANHPLTGLFDGKDKRSSELLATLLSSFQGSQSMGFVLKCLRAGGIDRVRYYHIAHRDQEKRTLILLCQASSKEAELKVGKFLKWNETIFAIRGRHEPWSGDGSAGSVMSFDGGDFSEVTRDALRLKGRSGVSILVTTNRSAGLLVLDWPGEDFTDGPEIRPRDEAFLILLARWLLGVALNPSIDTSRRQVISSSEVILVGKDQESTAHRLNELRQLARAGVLAMFNYDWRTGRLTKEWEIASEDLDPLDAMAEVYLPGKFHTGLAWADKKQRSIVDILESDSEETVGVYWPSHKRLSDWLGGEIGSVLYSRICNKGDGKLVRVMHRIDQPSASFGSIRSVFENESQSIGSELGVQELERLMKDLLDLAHAASFSARGVRKLRDAAAKILRSRSIPWVAFLHLIDDENVELWMINTDRGDDPEFTKSLADFPVKRVGQSEAFVSWPDLPEHYKDWLPKAESYFRVVVDNPLPTQLFVPVGLTLDIGDERVSREAKEFEALLAHPSSDMRLLGTLTELVALGRTVARFNDESADFATGYVRFMSHELLSRVNQIANGAAGALDDGADELDDGVSDPEAVAEDLRDSSRFVQRMNLELKRYLRPAVMLRRGSMHIERLPLRVDSVIASAVSQVKDRFSNDFCREWSVHPFAIVLHATPGDSDVGVVGDHAMLTQALVAMLDNAIKYSNPARSFLSMNSSSKNLVAWAPVRGRPGKVVGRGPDRASSRSKISVVSIDLRATGSTVSLAVKNWGVPVPEGADGLWRPFERGGVKDPRRAIPGLGIGLPLVWAAAASHLGDARLDSGPTLAEPAVREIHGWSTTCTLSVSRTLSAGTVEISFSDKED